MKQKSGAVNDRGQRLHALCQLLPGGFGAVDDVALVVLLPKECILNLLGLRLGLITIMKSPLLPRRPKKDSIAADALV